MAGPLCSLCACDSRDVKDRSKAELMPIISSNHKAHIHNNCKSMSRSTAFTLAVAALALSDLARPSCAFAPTTSVTIANKYDSRSSSLSMVFGFGSSQTRSGADKRKRQRNPQTPTLSARGSVVSSSLTDSEATSASIQPRSKIDTSNFGASSVGGDDTVRDAIRNDVYQHSLHRLLCDGEEECIF